jgi:hypothetical protein
MSRRADLEAKVKALRAKQKEFEQSGDLSNEITCKIIADFLEETLSDAELRADAGAPVLQDYLSGKSVTHI